MPILEADMPVGTICSAKQLGRRHTSNYILQACPNCGTKRWIETRHGIPRRTLCKKCAINIYGFGKELGYKNGFDIKNTNWHGDNVKEQAGRHRALRKFKDSPCVVCGRKGERHHIDGNTLNNETDNIKFLCRKHHMEAENGRLSRKTDGKYKCALY